MATNTGKRIWYATNEETKSGFSGLPIPIYLAKKWTGKTENTKDDMCDMGNSNSNNGGWGGAAWWFSRSDPSTILNDTTIPHAQRVESGWIEWENDKLTYPDYTPKQGSKIPLGVTIPTGDQRETCLIADGLGLIGPLTRKEVTKVWWTLNGMNLKSTNDNLTVNTSDKNSNNSNSSNGQDYAFEKDFSTDETERVKNSFIGGSYAIKYAGDDYKTHFIECVPTGLNVYCNEDKTEEYFIRIPINGAYSDYKSHSDHSHSSYTRLTNIYHPKIFVADGDNIIKNSTGCTSTDNTWAPDVCPYDDGTSTGNNTNTGWWNGGWWGLISSVPGKKEIDTSKENEWSIKFDSYGCTKSPDYSQTPPMKPCDNCQNTRILSSQKTTSKLRILDVKIKINEKDYNSKFASLEYCSNGSSISHQPGSADENGTFTPWNGTDCSKNTLTLECKASKYLEYATSKGDPVYDKTTGAELKDPLS